jgi:hypothetical protein
MRDHDLFPPVAIKEHVLEFAAEGFEPGPRDAGRLQLREG